MSPEVVRVLYRVSIGLVLLGLPFPILAYSRLEREHKTGISRTTLTNEARARRMRFWIVFWWIWLASVGSLFALSGLYEMAGQARANPDWSRPAALPVFVV